MGVGAKGTKSERKAQQWVDEAEAQFGKHMLPVHHGKSVNGVADVEFQGAMIHSTQHWLGASRGRRLLTLASAISLLYQFRIVPKHLEQLVGKLSYCQAFRSCTRSCFGGVYFWMHAAPSMRSVVGFDGPEWNEVLMAALLAPFMQQDLDSPWSPVLECTDAAQGGTEERRPTFLMIRWPRWPGGVIHDLQALLYEPSSALQLMSEGFVP